VNGCLDSIVAAIFTSPRLRGEVDARSAAGEGDSPRNALAESPTHANPLPASGARESHATIFA
jgi:DNA helicase-2/ATP-dependent DNA helicase PcrA